MQLTVNSPLPFIHISLQTLTCVPVLARLLYHTDPDVLCHSCWTAAFIADGPDSRIQRIVDGGLVNRLVELMLHHERSVVTPALRAVGNILTGDDVQTQVGSPHVRACMCVCVCVCKWK